MRRRPCGRDGWRLRVRQETNALDCDIRGPGVLSVRSVQYTELIMFLRQLLFDTMGMVLVIVNALHQPYQAGSQVVKRLQRDGTLLFVVRLLNIMVLQPR